MTHEELLLRRLSGQHLLSPADTKTPLRDLCGVQAQFLSHALHGLSIRCGEIRTDGLAKSWTLRGTMHLFNQEDLPLFLHQGRNHFLRPVDTLETDAFISRERKAYFAEHILAAIGEGTDEREALKTLCANAGMSEAESTSLFDPWGGIIRALCESGRIFHKVQEKKAYRLCPPFQPMEQDDALLELTRRYFTNFGPATTKDAAYFFKRPQSQVKALLSRLPLTQTRLEGKNYFYIERDLPAEAAVPDCLFLAGFDQLMLGYEKSESLFLPQEHLRDIFTRSGIVRPAVLIHGQAAGWWNLKGPALKITLFAPENRNPVTDAAVKLWGNAIRIEFT